MRSAAGFSLMLSLFLYALNTKAQTNPSCLSAASPKVTSCDGYLQEVQKLVPKGAVVQLPGDPNVEGSLNSTLIEEDKCYVLVNNASVNFTEAERVCEISGGSLGKVNFTHQITHLFNQDEIPGCFLMNLVFGVNDSWTMKCAEGHKILHNVNEIYSNRDVIEGGRVALCTNDSDQSSEVTIKFMQPADQADIFMCQRVDSYENEPPVTTPTYAPNKIKQRSATSGEKDDPSLDQTLIFAIVFCSLALVGIAFMGVYSYKKMPPKPLEVLAWMIESGNDPRKSTNKTGEPPVDAQETPKCDTGASGVIAQ